jgi:hypothetical protein
LTTSLIYIATDPQRQWPMISVEGNWMELYVSCDCGWSTVGVGDALIGSVREHGVSVHGVELSDEQILAAARPFGDAMPTPRKELADERPARGEPDGRPATDHRGVEPR